MHKAVRELIARVELIGWSLDGLDGTGHYRMIHTSGETFRVPATPSEYRSLKNALAGMERIAGQRTERVVRRSSRKAPETTGFSLGSAKAETATWHRSWDERVEQLHERRNEAIAELRECQGARREITKARSLVATILRCEQDLVEMHQPVERFDASELAEQESA